MRICKKIIIILLIFTLAGCVSTPERGYVTLKGPSYILDDIQYVPLNSIVDNFELKYKWDSIAKKLMLYRGDEKVIVCVGSNIVLVNGLPENLTAPARMRHGVIVLPKKFCETTLYKTFGSQRESSARKKEVTAKPIASIYKIKKIVLDPGHGGKDPGAIGELGIREKYITLDISERVAMHLNKAGIDTILTREDDRFISLWRRSDIANKEGADFFISIHANACRSKYVNGFEVFYLSEAVDDNARAIAATENASLKYEDSSFGNKRPSGTLEATLWDIEYSENRVESIEMAKCITDSSCKKLNTNNRGTKAAMFYVLKGAKMPSVLVEVGFISNKSEAKNLRSSEYRERLAKAIAAGIIDYKKQYEETEGFTR